MKVKFLKGMQLKELASNVEKNLTLYREGDFDFLVSDASFHFETNLVFDEDKIALISCNKQNLKEVEELHLMYEAIKDVSYYLARDERLWVYLTHTLLLDYARARWPIPQSDERRLNTLKLIFFATVRGESNAIMQRLGYGGKHHYVAESAVCP